MRGTPVQSPEPPSGEEAEGSPSAPPAPPDLDLARGAEGELEGGMQDSAPNQESPLVEMAPGAVGDGGLSDAASAIADDGCGGGEGEGGWVSFGADDGMD